MSLLKRLKNWAKVALWPLLPASFRAQRVARANASHFPDYVYFEPTTRCNLGCLHCGRTYWKSRGKQRDFSVDTFKRAATELRARGVSTLILQLCGEPLMHPQILDIVEFAKALGFQTRFTTNLSLLTLDMAERLVRSGHDVVYVSVDSSDPAVFNDLRRGTTLEKVVSNLRMLCEAKRRVASRTPHIQATAVLMRATLDGALDLVDAMKKVGVDSMNFQQLNTEGINLDVVLQDGTTMRQNALQNTPIDQLKKEIAEIKACHSLEFPITVPGDFSGFKMAGPQGPGILTCAELWESSCVDSAGRVTPCCWLPDGSLMNLGDLNEQTFEEIWFGERYERLRHQHLSNQHPPQCKSCQQLFYTVAKPSRLSLNRQTARLYTRVFKLNKSNCRG